MKIAVLVTGILLIIGGTLDNVLTPQIIDRVNTLTNNLQTSFMPQIGNSEVNSAYASSLTEINSQIVQLISGIGMVEKISEYSSWTTIVVGMGVVIYAVFTKSSRVQTIRISRENAEGFKISKMKRIKEDMTKKEFDAKGTASSLN